MRDLQNTTEYTVEQKAAQEGLKLAYDVLKHLTTLNTGSIIILSTFLEKFFTKPYWKLLVVSAFICFAFSIVTAFISMFCAADRVYSLEKQDKPTERILICCTIISILLFIAGIILFVIFSIRNFLNYNT